MKIRTDFVTNSSSVSYIITMNLEFIEFLKAKKPEIYTSDEKRKRIYNAISRDLAENGTKVTILDREVYCKRYALIKKRDCKYEDSFEKPIDFAALSEEELWSYIYGEYFVNGRLSNEFKGFSSLQVIKDMPKIEEVKCEEKSENEACAACEKRDTDQCHKAKKK